MAELTAEELRIVVRELERLRALDIRVDGRRVSFVLPQV